MMRRDLDTRRLGMRIELIDTKIKIYEREMCRDNQSRISSRAALLQHKESQNLYH